MLAPLAYGIGRGLSKFLDLPQRLPFWNRLLRYIWVPAVGLLLLAVVFRLKTLLLGDGYRLFALGALLGALWPCAPTSRPARCCLPRPHS